MIKIKREFKVGTKVYIKDFFYEFHKHWRSGVIKFINWDTYEIAVEIIYSDDSNATELLQYNLLKLIKEERIKFQNDEEAIITSSYNKPKKLSVDEIEELFGKETADLIVITVRGNNIYAALKDRNNNILKEAKARCHPNDEFDFEEGAKWAFGRLFDDDFDLDKVRKEKCLEDAIRDLC